jgi:hypothetical protein
VVEVLGEQGKHSYTASKAYFRYFDRGWREKVRSARAAGPLRSRHVVRECLFFPQATQKTNQCFQNGEGTTKRDHIQMATSILEAREQTSSAHCLIFKNGKSTHVSVRRAFFLIEYFGGYREVRNTTEPRKSLTYILSFASSSDGRVDSGNTL